MKIYNMGGGEVSQNSLAKETEGQKKKKRPI